MFVAKDIWGRSAWYVATENSKVQLFQKLWELAKIVLTEEELNNKMFITKHNFGRIAWDMAQNMTTFRHCTDGEWAKELLTRKELNNKSSLAKDDGERTAWHVAV